MDIWSFSTSSYIAIFVCMLSGIMGTDHFITGYLFLVCTEESKTFVKEIEKAQNVFLNRNGILCQGTFFVHQINVTVWIIPPRVEL